MDYFAPAVMKNAEMIDNNFIFGPCMLNFCLLLCLSDEKEGGRGGWGGD